MRAVAVIDGTGGSWERQARAMSAFLRDGLTGDVEAETVVFYDDERRRQALVDLAPTRDVRLVSTTARRPDRILAALAAAADDGAAGGAARLFLFAGGAVGTELAARLACRLQGGAFTDALGIEVRGKRVVCRRNVYSNHLVGRFELASPPWCAGIDPSWSDAGDVDGAGGAGGAAGGGLTHQILSDTEAPGAGGSHHVEAVEVLDAPSAGDLVDSRFLVVAGSGAGSREGVERIAAAAARMGAAFGATRPVVMNGWAPMDRLVGVSGSRAAPGVCLVVGASGAPALHWGIERARFLAAVNLDEHAPIVENADAVLVDDGVTVMEELARIVAARRENG